MMLIAAVWACPSKLLTGDIGVSVARHALQDSEASRARRGGERFGASPEAQLDYKSEMLNAAFRFSEAGKGYLCFFLPRAQDWRIFSAIKALVAALMTRLRRPSRFALPAVFPVRIATALLKRAISSSNRATM
jgi:hypothetical protein